MGWRLAKSLTVLGNEIDAAAPGRSTASDGTIGDTSHQARPSDHNPNRAGVVCAADYTHDPASGADMHRIAEHLRTKRVKALKYVIFNRRIASAASGWRWTFYGGSNPHTAHMHVSVGRGADGRSTGPYDDTSSWGIPGTTQGVDDVIGLEKGDSGQRVKGLQYTLRRAGFDPGEPDGDYGPNTVAALAACRKAMGSTDPDGGSVTGAGYSQILTALARREAVKVLADLVPGKLPEEFEFTGTGTIKAR